MKRIIALLLLLAVSLTACGKGAAPVENTEQTVETVAAPGGPDVAGVSLPNDIDPRWQTLAATLEETMSRAGLSAVVEYAADDVTQQIAQVEAMVRRKVGCLVIAAIDPLPLSDVLQQAKQAGIPVIAYDRMLTLTDAVTAYVGFDSAQIGLSVANRIVQEKQLQTAQEEGRSYTVELFMGAGEDPNAHTFYEGVWSVLLPYIESGVLVCHSGRTAFEDVCVWDGDLATKRLEQYLRESYADSTPDILITGSDEIAGALWEALEASGRLPVDTLPLITGLGATAEGVKRILAGQQSITVYCSDPELIERCATATQMVLSGESLAHLSAACDNGQKLVPAFFADAQIVDGENYRRVLANSGIDTE